MPRIFYREESKVKWCGCSKCKATDLRGLTAQVWYLVCLSSEAYCSRYKPQTPHDKVSSQEGKSP